MTEPTRLLFSFLASPAYERFLKRLHKKLAVAGTTCPDDPLRIAELAIATLGLQHGLLAPARTAGVGGKRAGAGRKPKTAAGETA